MVIIFRSLLLEAIYESLGPDKNCQFKPSAGFQQPYSHLPFISIIAILPVTKVNENEELQADIIGCLLFQTVKVAYATKPLSLLIVIVSIEIDADILVVELHI